MGLQVNCLETEGLPPGNLWWNMRQQWAKPGLAARESRRSVRQMFGEPLANCKGVLGGLLVEQVTVMPEREEDCWNTRWKLQDYAQGTWAGA